MENIDQRNLEERALALLPAIRRMARAVTRKLPSLVSVDDLIGAGNLGLVQAIRAYEPQPSASFEAYACCRARGAMLDEIRRLDTLTRGQRRELFVMRRAEGLLRARLEREPTPDEVASECGLSRENHDRLVAAAQARRAVSLQSGSGGGDESIVEPAADTPDGEALTLARHENERLVFAAARLPERMRNVLQMSFEQEKKLREVATELGVSEARAHQLREAAVERLARAYRSVSIVPPHRVAARSRKRMMGKDGGQEARPRQKSALKLAFPVQAGCRSTYP